MLCIGQHDNLTRIVAQVWRLLKSSQSATDFVPSPSQPLSLSLLTCAVSKSAVLTAVLSAARPCVGVDHTPLLLAVVALVCSICIVGGAFCVLRCPKHMQRVDDSTPFAAQKPVELGSKTSVGLTNRKKVREPTKPGIPGEHTYVALRRHVTYMATMLLEFWLDICSSSASVRVCALAGR